MSRLVKPVVLALSCYLLSCAAEPTPAPQIRFAEVTRAAGIHFQHHSGNRVKNYLPEAKGGGGALLDYDNDGYLDLYLVNGSRFGGRTPADQPSALYHNQGDGTFAETTAQAGVGDTSWGMGCAAADYDNDGDSDLYLTSFGTNVLYRNEGKGRFASAAPQAGVALEGWSTGAGFGDFDQDGDLDLYVARYVDFSPERVPPKGGMWKGTLVFAGPLGLPASPDVLYCNEGDGTFADCTRQAGLAASPPGYGLGVVWGDYDDDGDPDLYVANDSEPNFLYQNQGKGTFAEVGLQARAALSAEGLAQASMGLAYGDYDNDGRQDYLATHFEDEYNTLYHNQGDGTFAVASFEAGLGEPSLPMLGFGTCFLDYDNDGDLDLAVANGHVYPQVEQTRPGTYTQPGQLFVNQGAPHGWRFALAADDDLSLPRVGRGLCKGDYDNDGDVDLLLLNLDGPPALLRNEGGNRNHWLVLKLAGTRSNRDGIGARIAVTAGGLRQVVEVAGGGSFLSHSDQRAHFGLGAHTRAEQVEIRWPTGAVQYLREVAADQFLTVSEE